MILEVAAWMLGALIGHAVGLVLGYRMGFVACDQGRTQEKRWPHSSRRRSRSRR